MSPKAEEVSRFGTAEASAEMVFASYVVVVDCDVMPGIVVESRRSLCLITAAPLALVKAATAVAAIEPTALPRVKPVRAPTTLSNSVTFVVNVPVVPVKPFVVVLRESTSPWMYRVTFVAAAFVESFVKYVARPVWVELASACWAAFGTVASNGVDPPPPPEIPVSLDPSPTNDFAVTVPEYVAPVSRDIEYPLLITTTWPRNFSGSHRRGQDPWGHLNTSVLGLEEYRVPP